MIKSLAPRFATRNGLKIAGNMDLRRAVLAATVADRHAKRRRRRRDEELMAMKKELEDDSDRESQRRKM